MAGSGREVEAADMECWNSGLTVTVDHPNRKQERSVAGETEGARNKMLQDSTRPDYITVVCGGLKMARNSPPLLT